MCISRFRHFYNVGHFRIRAAIGNVFFDRTAKQERFLGYQANLGAQAMQIHLVNIKSINLNLPAGGVKKTGDEIHQRSFSHPAGTDNRNDLRGFHFQIDILKHQLILGIAKAYIFKTHPPFDPRQDFGLLRLHGFGCGFHNFKDSFGCPAGFFKLRITSGQFADR